ncbi:MAG: hypothetical protein K5Q00_06710, partial [Gammaproteobacteria bacterium]|nr:hypothetical protein [Gammaproteobacteria bacterium]
MPPNRTPVPGSKEFFRQAPDFHNHKGHGGVYWPDIFDKCDLKSLITWHGNVPRMRDAIDQYLKDRYGEDPEFFHIANDGDKFTFWWGKVPYYAAKVPANIPASLSSIPINRIKFIVSEGNKSVFLLDDIKGSVHAWGENQYWPLGLGHRRLVDIPTEIVSLRGIKITQVFPTI